MADFSALKAAIQAAIRQNGNNEITGNIMQGILLSMVNTLGDAAINQLIDIVNQLSSRIADGYMYAGVATPSGTPTAASGKVFYVALQDGTYTNYGNTAVKRGLTIIWNDGASWGKDELLLISDDVAHNISNVVSSEAVSVIMAVTIDRLFKDSLFLNGVIRYSLSEVIRTDGKFINALGNEYDDATYSYTYIELSNFDSVKLVASNITSDSAVLNVCDTNKAMIQNLRNWSSLGTILFRKSELPSGAAYLCLSFKTVDLSKINIEILGKNILTPINENAENITKLYSTDNGIYLNMLRIAGYAKVPLTELEIVNHKYISTNGVLYDDDSFAYAFVKVAPFDAFRINAYGLSDSIVVNTHNANKDFLQNIVSWGTSADVYRTKQDVNANTVYLSISAKIVDIEKIVVNILNPDYQNNQAFKVDGGVTEKHLADEVVCFGYYISNSGVRTAYSEYCYAYVDISRTKKFIINGNGIDTDSAVVNYCNGGQYFVRNLVNWNSLNGIESLTESLSPEIKYICISCKVSDIGKITVTRYYDGLEDAIREKSDSDNLMMARYDAAYSKTLGIGKDVIKGLFLDAGRKYFNVTNIKKLIDNAYAAGLNTFCIYFSDNNGFRFGLDNMNVVANGKTYDLSVALGDGLSPTDGTDKWLTQSDMDEIIAYATSKGIQVIPAFDMPGHMGAIRQYFYAAEFMETTEAGRNWMVAVFDKYVSYFASKGCRYFNVCGDEYYGGTQADYMKIMTRLMRCITLHSMIPLIYNDMICKDGYNLPYIDNGALVIGWIHRSGEMAEYPTIVNSGFKMINGKNNPFYWILGSTVVTPELIQAIRIAPLFVMADGSVDKDIAGVMYHIWCDQADADGADEGDNVIEQTASCIEAFGYNISTNIPTEYLPEEEIFLRANNGSIYRLTVSNSGELNVQIVT